jgi:hypothetical protein
MPDETTTPTLRDEDIRTVGSATETADPDTTDTQDVADTTDTQDVADTTDTTDTADTDAADPDTDEVDTADADAQDA